MELFAALYSAIEAFPAPTIAVCVGNVVGAGAELACGCDLRVGGDNLKLVFPGARLGVPVGPARLVPLVGLSKARGADLHRPRRRRRRRPTRSASWPVARRPPRPRPQRSRWPRELAAHPAEGLRHLKQLFRDYEDTAARVARENGEIVEFQRTGGGLPYGGVRR